MQTQEPQQQPGTNDNSLESNQKKIYGIWENAMAFLHELLDIRQDSDREATIESVRSDISIQGHNAWILIFSILIASIGLNANSTAVVIGAMLISPLMGPIVGMGLGTAINDHAMLRRSWINLAVMVGLSLLTASLYFLITPFKEPTDELMARTFPTTLDVFIAVSGGLALIVAKAKKGTISNAVAGVAIATALMPPLCTAGYGIATGDLKIFGGAMYLFCINTVFIALSTYVVSKLLGFPLVKYANQAKRKRVSRWATVIGLVALLPSFWFFYQTYQREVVYLAVEDYSNKYIEYDGTRYTKDWSKKNDTTLEITLYGAPVPQPVIDDWKSEFYKVKDLKGYAVRFYQGSAIVETDNEEMAVVQEELIDKLKAIQDKEVRIQALEKEIDRIQKAHNDFTTLSEEIRINYPAISAVSFSNSVNKDFETQKTDTTAVFNVSFRDSTMRIEDREYLKKRMASWLGYRLGTNKLAINEVARSVQLDSVKVEP